MCCLLSYTKKTLLMFTQLCLLISFIHAIVDLAHFLIPSLHLFSPIYSLVNRAFAVIALSEPRHPRRLPNLKQNQICTKNSIIINSRHTNTSPPIPPRPRFHLVMVLLLLLLLLLCCCCCCCCCGIDKSEAD